MFLKNLLNLLVVKPVVWVASRFGGKAAGDAAEAQIEAEINAAKPVLLSIVDRETAAVVTVANAAIDTVRQAIVLAVPSAKLSADASAKVVATINAVQAPAEVAADAAITAFAQSVKNAIAAL